MYPWNRGLASRGQWSPGGNSADCGQVRAKFNGGRVVAEGRPHLKGDPRGRLGNQAVGGPAELEVSNLLAFTDLVAAANFDDAGRNFRHADEEARPQAWP